MVIAAEAVWDIPGGFRASGGFLLQWWAGLRQNPLCGSPVPVSALASTVTLTVTHQQPYISQTLASIIALSLHNHLALPGDPDRLRPSISSTYNLRWGLKTLLVCASAPSISPSGRLILRLHGLGARRLSIITP